MPESASSAWTGWGLRTLALTAIVVLAMGVTLGGEFVYDDDILIRDNPTVKDASVFATSVFDSFFVNTVNEGNLMFFRPLVMTTYFLTFQAVGLTAWPFHLTNLLIHLVNGMMIWGMARLWFSLGRGPALVAAAVFLVHPIQTETVAWISGRTDLLCTAGVLGALLLAWRWIHRPTTGALLALGAVLSIGLLSKELAIVTPALFAVLVWTRWRLLRRWPGAGRRCAIVFGLLTLLGLAFLAIRSLALARWETEVTWPTGDPWTTRLSMPSILLLYLRLLVWPHPYVLDYTRTNFPPVESFADPRLWAALSVIVALTLLGLWLIWRRRPAGAALAWFAITIAPVSQIRPLVVMAAEHYLYLPALCIAVLVGLGWQSVRPHVRGRWALSGGLAALLILCAVSTSRCLIWHDNVTLFEHTWRQDPENHHKANNYAHILVGLDRPAEALEVIRWTDRPETSIGLETEVVALINMGRTEEGLALLHRLIERFPDHAEAHAILAGWHLHRGDLDAAERSANEARRFRPHNRRALVTLASVWRERGETDRAWELLEGAGVWISPSEESLALQAALAVERGDWPRAGELLESLLEFDPDNVNALVDLGIARHSLGDQDAAIRLWQRALEIDPECEPARLNLEALSPK
ncbi:tetratricopeptide repeat protein [Candidatus Sumerlaeota bacterium]|nr:tetratricopeptide repeat protein [Candidatus Sumerlaeota bacterium]